MLGSKLIGFVITIVLPNNYNHPEKLTSVMMVARRLLSQKNDIHRKGSGSRAIA